MKKIEILAPAGSYEGMRAAMNAGCDAVYIGGASFGARAYANNLTEATLLQAIDEAHIRDKKLYLTVNTLLKEKELTGKLYSFLEKYYLQGLDAVIVQDVGVMHFIHRNFPELPIHASTQMTLTMAQGANLLKAYGVTRLVTSRELSLKEIKNIRDNTDLEIETFVHGALCYCYSGQCLMSSMIGGRSGNRGRCAQPCRMPYQFYSGDKKVSKNQEKYLLSPKDINTIKLIPQLVEAGINSFKIEGRMKRPEYTAAVSALYRKYLDYYLEHGKDKFNELLSDREYEKDMVQLMDIYNRGGFSEGYGMNYHGKSMMSLSRPNHSGVFVGEVSSVKGGSITIQLKDKINAQDILEIRYKDEEGYEFTVKDQHQAGDFLETYIGVRKDIKNADNSLASIRIGNPVYRTKNNELLEVITKNYLTEDKKLSVTGLLTARTGEKLSLTITCLNFTVTVYHDIVQKAMKQPMSKEKLIAPLSKTGDTLFYFDELTIEADDNIFVPVAWLNEIRREAFHKLEGSITDHFRRDHNMYYDDSTTSDLEVFSSDVNVEKRFTAVNKPGFIVSVQTSKQFETALHFSEVTQIFADYDRFGLVLLPDMAEKAGKAGKSFYLSLPMICRQEVYNRLKVEIFEIKDLKCISGFIINNFEEAALLQSLLSSIKLEKEIILNHNMYIYNKEAKSFWLENGITRFTAPLELNLHELRQLGIEDCDIMVYGYLPLMISAQCLYESTSGCQKCRQGNTGSLTDRMGKKFYVQTNCLGCYNIIYNGQALALHKQENEISELVPKNIRLDFTMESSHQMEQVLKLFIETYLYKRKSAEVLTEYTTGHFKRGIE